MGHTASTFPPRTHTRLSWRLAGGSQWPGVGLSLSPGGERALGASLSTPCSSEALMYSTPSASTTRGGPESTLDALSPASTTAWAAEGLLITVAQTNRLCSK